MAKDLFHDVVKQALIAEGWQITHDPLPVDYGDVQMQIDLGAEHLLAAERGTEKIAVEVKSFLSPSAISEFHTAAGQYFNYRHALGTKEPERKLYLAVPNAVYEQFFRLQFVQEIVQIQAILLVVYEPKTGRIQWIG
ncbi:MAG: fatty-acid oxidation protein subunit alpha [Spirulinaceae cyanobacterium RM2_2_10]|nr:fatty-acid oxidation protein subunit alpha [Spirulinaceae cyanobacterium SM2_1_0]NJO21239.1 fatty-acid oxidation protein subunit alpha [Spirulinaceae cyanobacterium RM2_2_10]